MCVDHSSGGPRGDGLRIWYACYVVSLEKRSEVLVTQVLMCPRPRMKIPAICGRTSEVCQSFEPMFEIEQDSLIQHTSLEERAKKAIGMGVVQQTWLN